MTLARSSIPSLTFSLALLVLAGPALAGPEARTEKAAPRYSSLNELVRSMRDRIVSLDVQREKEDEERSRPRRQAFRGLDEGEREGLRLYYQRPPGHVSGLLLDHEGHVLTSYYNVLGKVEKIRATLSDGSTHEATIRAISPFDDLALLKTEAPLDREKLPLGPLEWAPPERVRSGLFTVAVGSSPRAGHTTATVGIISAPSRNAGRAFQTDAAMNYGNVGGPLINLQGQVLGLSAFVGHTYPHWGFNSGIGFGVRADLIQKLLPRLKRGESLEFIERPLLGVSTAPDHSGPGARVRTVLPGSGASRAGLKPGDVIVELGGKPVIDFPHLRHLIFKHRAGETIPVKVQRGEESLDLEIVLGRYNPTQ